MRACPRSDGCLARDSSRRRFSLYSAAASTTAPIAYGITCVTMALRSSMIPRPRQHNAMTVRSLIAQVALQEDFNFLVTNRIPRRLVTQFMGWFSKIEQPLIRDLSIAVWRLFADPNLAEAAKSEFSSLHDCFVRELKSGARTIDPDPSVLVSPCDAIVGASGRVDGDRLIQAKGFDYQLADLLPHPELVSAYRDGHYVTLRLSSSMYHRFHAPHDGVVEQVTYISGDTWNTNPITVKRVERLFCKNERAVLQTRLTGSGHLITLVPVASILVASIRL